MAKEIELPDGSIAEFPDDMHDDAIGEVLRKQFAPPQATQSKSAQTRDTGWQQPPGKDPDLLTEFLGGAKHAWDRAAYGVADIFTPNQMGNDSPLFPSAAQRKRELQEGGQFVKQTGPASTVGQIAGDIAMSAAPAARAYQGGKVLARTLGAVKPWQVAAVPLAVEAATNAGYGALTADEGERGLGAALGAGGTVLGHSLTGFRPTAEAAELMRQGVQPSFGQSMGGMTNRIEQKLSSVPFVGDAINFARNRAQKEFEQAALDRALKGSSKPGLPGVTFIPQPKTVDDAFKMASELYEAVVPSLKPTPQAEGNILIAMGNASRNPELTADGLKIINGVVGKYFPKFNELKADELKRLDSELGHIARKYQGGSPSERTIAAEVYKLQDGLRRGLEYGLPPVLRGTMTQANAIWRNMIPISQAASRRGDEKIMPRALQQTLARQAKTDTARFSDPLIDPAVAVLSSTVPDSGTAGRLLFGLGGLGAGAAMGALPQMALAGAATGIGATRLAQQALVGNTAWQRAAAPYDPEMAAILSAALRGQINNNE